MPSKTREKNAAIAAKSPALQKIPKEGFARRCVRQALID
jgi:hypothetical protein